MFESLSDRFEGIFTRLRSKGTLREADVDEVLREIRLALLEADVNFVVVKTMLDRIRERAVGARIHEALNPAQQVVKLVNEELVETLGGETIRHPLRLQAAHRRAHGRPAGLGQDHQRGQARPLVPPAGPQPAAGRRRPAAPGRRRAAAHPGRADRRAGVQPSRGDPVATRQGRRRGGPAPRPRRLHRRHRRPPGHRRRDDGPGPAHLRRRPSPTTRSSSSTP